MAKSAITWLSKSFTDVGKVRQCNEDSLLDKKEAGIWVVADGMGGHEAGDIASQMIIRRLDELSPRAYISDYVDLVEDALVKINQELIDYSRTEKNGTTVGSTVVCFIARGETGVALWVGDSRLYRLRDGVFSQMTIDHSEVQRLVDEGVITQEQADKSVFKNVLTRAMGAHEKVDIDVNAFKIAAGDRFILCSDGVYNELSDEQLADLLNGKNFDTVGESLRSACANSPARDNYSMIALACV